MIQQPVPKLWILNFPELYNSWIVYDNKNNTNNQTRLIKLMKIWFCGLEFVVGSGVQDKYLVKQQIYENNSSRNYLNPLCAPSQSCQNKNVLENLVFGKMDREMNSSSSTCCHPLVHCILWVKCELASRLRECRYETFRYGEIFKMKRVLMSDFYLKN